MLPGQGRAGVVVDARPLGEARDGQQLVALRIKAEARGNAGSGEASAPASRPGSAATPITNLAVGGAASKDAPSFTSATSAPSGPTSAKRLDQLSAAEKADVAKLQQRDQQVRQEEKAHAAVAGDLAGPINYVYQRGPDGRQYAVGGSVSVQATTRSGDPEEAKRLGARMAVAANAATNPSAQDYATARKAYAFGSGLAEPAVPDERPRPLDLSL